MLLEAYRAIKTELENKTTGIKLIDWFNDQYSGTIHTVPAVFVEFPKPLQFETLKGQIQQAEFTVKIHLASQIKADVSKRIDETLIETHENLVKAIYFAMQGFSANYGTGEKLFNSIGRTEYEHHQYIKGWFVTMQHFEGVIYQLGQTKEKVSRPSVNINY